MVAKRQNLDLVSEVAPWISFMFWENLQRLLLSGDTWVYGWIVKWVDPWIHGWMHESVSMFLSNDTNLGYVYHLMYTARHLALCFYLLPFTSYSSYGSTPIEIYFQKGNFCQSLAVDAFRILLSIQAKTMRYLDISQPMIKHRNGVRALPCIYAGLFY